MADVFVSELRRMPISLHMRLILARSLNVHISRVPVALLRHALRTPVRPYTEFCIAIPIWALVGLERFPVGLKRPIGDLPAKYLRISGFRHCSPCED